MSTEVRVPTLGESVTEATVATWFKKPGDSVAVDEMLCELETDKVTVEVPSPIAGTLSEIVAAEGETVGVDALLAQISEGGADNAAASAPKASSEAAPAKKPANTLATGGTGTVNAGPEDTKLRDPEDAPSAQKLMAEKGIDRDAVTATGKDGRVM